MIGSPGAACLLARAAAAAGYIINYMPPLANICFGGRRAVVDRYVAAAARIRERERERESGAHPRSATRRPR